MLAQKKTRARRRARDAQPDWPEETRAAEVVTVAWMLTLLTALGSEFISLTAMGLAEALGDPPGRIGMLVALIYFTSFIAGGLAVLLMVAAVRVRKTRPPDSLLILSGLAAGLPWLSLLIFWLLDRTAG